MSFCCVVLQYLRCLGNLGWLVLVSTCSFVLDVSSFAVAIACRSFVFHWLLCSGNNNNDGLPRRAEVRVSCNYEWTGPRKSCNVQCLQSVISYAACTVLQMIMILQVILVYITQSTAVAQEFSSQTKQYCWEVIWVLVCRRVWIIMHIYQCLDQMSPVCWNSWARPVLFQKG